MGDMDTHGSVAQRGTRAVFTPWPRALTIAVGWVVVAVTWVTSTADGGENLAWAPALVLAGITTIWFEGRSVRDLARRFGFGALTGPPRSGRP